MDLVIQQILFNSIYQNIVILFIGRTDVETKAPILWPPGAKSQLIGKDPEAGKDWRQKKKAMVEDTMVR